MTMIGFIGLGHMGGPMAKNLLAKGFRLKVFDANHGLVAALTKEGAIATKSVAELVKDCEIIFTMVQTGEQVKQCCLGAAGIFANMHPQALYIDGSSIDVKTSKELHQIAEDKAIAMLDAPVSGGVAAAINATLTFMIGGSDRNFARAKTLLGNLGKTIVHTGGAGSGVAAKICNNMLLGISMIAVSEAFVLADKLELAPEKLFEVCSNASGECWSLTKYCPWPDLLENVPSSNGYKPGFTAKMMLKDLKLSQGAAQLSDAHVPLAQHATKLYQRFVDEGGAEVDFSGIINMLREEDL